MTLRASAASSIQREAAASYWHRGRAAPMEARAAAADTGETATPGLNDPVLLVRERVRADMLVRAAVCAAARGGLRQPTPSTGG